MLVWKAVYDRQDRKAETAAQNVSVISKNETSTDFAQAQDLHVEDTEEAKTV